MTEIDEPHPDALRVPDPHPVPLARTVEMPPEVDFRAGALAFRISNLVVLPAGVSIGVPVDDGVRTLAALPPLVVRGRYAVEATPDSVTGLDAGGDLSVLPDEATAPRAPVDEPVEAWLDQAREQRRRLCETPNGLRLVQSFYEHDDVFGELFDASRSDFVKDVWAPHGGTRRMAAHTHAAIGQDTVVNDGEYRDPLTGRPKPYNDAAFVRQVGVLSYLGARREEAPTPRAARYEAAAEAVLKFVRVVNETGNTGSRATAMNRTAVYAAVERHSGAEPEVDEAELRARLDPEADTGWHGWDDDERELARRFHRLAIRDRAARLAPPVTTLFSGEIEIPIAGAATVLMPDGPSVDLPAFEVRVDDSDWTGAAGRIARERLGQIGFLPDLLRAAITERLRRAVVDGELG